MFENGFKSVVNEVESKSPTLSQAISKPPFNKSPSQRHLKSADRPVFSRNTFDNSRKVRPELWSGSSSGKFRESLQATRREESLTPKTLDVDEFFKTDSTIATQKVFKVTPSAKTIVSGSVDEEVGCEIAPKSKRKSKNKSVSKSSRSQKQQSTKTTRARRRPHLWMPVGKQWKWAHPPKNPEGEKSSLKSKNKFVGCKNGWV